MVPEHSPQQSTACRSSAQYSSRFGRPRCTPADDHRSDTLGRRAADRRATFFTLLRADRIFARNKACIADLRRLHLHMPRRIAASASLGVGSCGGRKGNTLDSWLFSNKRSSLIAGLRDNGSTHATRLRYQQVSLSKFMSVVGYV